MSKFCKLSKDVFLQSMSHKKLHRKTLMAYVNRIYVASFCFVLSIKNAKQFSPPYLNNKYFISEHPRILVYVDIAMVLYNLFFFWWATYHYMYGHRQVPT